MAANDTDRLNLVSSFYGPGAVGCWYLTSLSCLISWTVHPKKRLSGSIDNDFIAFLTFPAVSAGHLILQTKNFSSIDETQQSLPENLLQTAAALEASLIITETFLLLGVLLILIAVYCQCVRRGFLLAAVAVFGFLAEVYLDVSQPSSRVRHALLHRHFLISYRWLLLVVSILVSTLVVFSSSIISLFYIQRPPQSSVREVPSDIFMRYGSQGHSLEREEIMRLRRRPYRDDFLSSLHSRILLSSTFLVMPLCALSSVGINFVDAASHAPPIVWPWIQATSSKFLRNLLPRTAYSLKELDQAVAMFAGATVLCFSIYGAALAQYESYEEKRQSEYHIRRRQRRIRLQQLLSHPLREQV